MLVDNKLVGANCGHYAAYKGQVQKRLLQVEGGFEMLGNDNFAEVG